MLVVSDTSPITNLIQINQLKLLNKIFGIIVVPDKVFEELSVHEKHKEEIDRQDWILVKSVKNKELVKTLEKQLDLGEAEAIVLAKELEANFLIIDERKGRKIAEKYDLKIIGLLGVLIQGKKKGYLKKLTPILDKLIEEIGFRVSKILYERILKEVGEK